MSKKILVILMIFISFFTLAACRRQSLKEVSSLPVNSEVPATGVILDITDKNNQIVFANLGDEILVSLRGKQKDKQQWSFREPVNGGYLRMTRHNVITENDKRLAADEFISEWKFKIIKSGIFNLRLDYEDASLATKPKKIYRVKVYSGQDLSTLKNIIVESPSFNEAVKDLILLTGYAKTVDGQVNYRLKTEAGEILTQGKILTSTSAPIFSYFEKEIKISQPADQKVILEVFQIDPANNQEVDLIEIDLGND